MQIIKLKIEHFSIQYRKSVKNKPVKGKTKYCQKNSE